MPSGEDECMSSEHLKMWYGKFGFKGSPKFKREPRKK